MSYQSQYTGEQIDEAVGKANKALVVPDTAPGAPRIVAINSDGSQQDLTLGTGITIENGVISASGGGGGAEYITINFTAFTGTTMVDYKTTVKLPYITGKQLIDYLCVVGFVSLRSTKWGSNDTYASTPDLIVVNEGKCAYRYIDYTNNNFGPVNNVNKVTINGSNVTSTDYIKTVVTPTDTIDIELYYSSGND